MSTVYDGFEDMNEQDMNELREQSKHEEEIYNLSDEQLEQLMEYHGE